MLIDKNKSYRHVQKQVRPLNDTASVLYMPKVAMTCMDYLIGCRSRYLVVVVKPLHDCIASVFHRVLAGYLLCRVMQL